MQCTRCGFQNDAVHRFCGKCGAQLDLQATAGPGLVVASTASSRYLSCLGVGLALLAVIGLGVLVFLWWSGRSPADGGRARAAVSPTPVVERTSEQVDPPYQSPTPTQVPPTATPTFTPAPTATNTPDPNRPLAQYDLAFTSDREGTFAVYLMDSSDPKQWLALPAPEEYEYLYWPTFCGPRLAFEAVDQLAIQPRWIYFVDPLAKTVEKFQPPAGQAADKLAAPGCSPEGRMMAYSASRQTKWSLDVVDLAQGTLVFETSWQRYLMLGFPSWTADGNLLYWMGALDSGYFDINETLGLLDAPNAVTNKVAKGKYPAVSPDGQRLAYFCGNLLTLCVVEWPSGNKLFERDISYFKKIAGQPVTASAAWSADGEWLYYSSSVTGTWDIYRVRRDGSEAQNLTENWPGDELAPTTR